jgi:multidrug resistance protein, MATE family
MSDDESPQPKAEPPRRPLAELLHLAVPTVTQMASYTTMQFIDTWILSRLGETAATAAGNSGMLAFAFISMGMGTLVLVNTLVSQSFGRGELEKCGQYLWQGIWLALIYGMALLPLRLAAGPIFAVFHHPAMQQALEAEYFRISLLSAGVKLVSASIGQFFLGINRPNAVLAGAVFGVSVNAITAWCIVLGHWGFAPHGVAGAAWAQNVGVTCELLMLIALATRASIDSAYGASDMRIRPRLMAMLLRIGLPSGGQWFSDILAWSLFCNGVMGLIGPAAMAANTFMLRYMVVSFLPVYGLSVAVTALVGRYIGRGEPRVARQRAHLGLAVAMTHVVCCGTVFVLARRPLIGLFSTDPQVDRIGQMLLILAAIYEFSDALYILYSGALRGAGDTLVPTLATAGMCWSIMLGGGFYVAWRWPAWVTGPWTIACVYGWILGAWMMGRFVRGKWERIRLR